MHRPAQLLILAFWQMHRPTNKFKARRPDFDCRVCDGEWLLVEFSSSDRYVEAFIDSERHFEVEYFEDRAIGTAFVQYGIHPYHYDLVAVGALHDAGGGGGRGPWEMPVHPRG